MFTTEVLQSDVLCIGGGIAGLMAAVRAAELGASVIVAEKANTLRSGSGGMGADHFQCYLPEIHGSDIQPVLAQCLNSPMAAERQPSYFRKWLEKSADIVKLWNSWGIPMQYHGNWEFAGHTLPGRLRIYLKYAGPDEKVVLTREAARRGVDLCNRVMIYDLLKNAETLNGALGVDTREPRFVVFQAKAVILTTGRCNQVYPSPTPALQSNRSHSPATNGDGRAMAYRAGAELVNPEICRRWAGPKNFCRGGKATWVGVTRDPDGRPLGPFVSAPDKRFGDPITDVYPTLFVDSLKTGRGPIYFDCRGISDADLAYMQYWLSHEGNLATLQHLKEEGLDLQKNAVEFTTYEPTVAGGILYDENGQTSVKGLFAAGDEYFGGISGAAVFGWFAGETAAAYARQTTLSEIDPSLLTEKQALPEQFCSRTEGPDWREALLALQQIMLDYAGPLRSETLLRAGTQHIKRLRQRILLTLKASNQHELMHALEVLNILDVGDCLLAGSLDRQETRQSFVRADFPFTNPLLNGKLHIAEKAGSAPVFSWRSV